MNTGSPMPLPGLTTQCDLQNRNLTINSIPDSFNQTVSACQETPKTFNVITSTNTTNNQPANFESPSVSVTAINGAPIANPITVTGGQINVNSNGDITFTPNTGFTGTSTFTYTVTPSLSVCASETRNVNITVNPSPTITGGNTVNTGSAIQLSGSGTPAATNPWVSDNTAVATVSNTGLVTGVSAGTATITYTNSSGCKETVTITVAVATTLCYKPAGTAGTILDTNHGITSLGRAGADNSNWPMVRKGAWTALEAKTKGL